MADIELILEAERRGILPDDKKGLLAEARARGLVAAGAGGAPEPQDGGPAAPEEPGAGEYLLDRAKKGLAGFSEAGDMSLPHPALVPFQVLAKLVASKINPQKRSAKEVLGYQGLKTENDAMRYVGGVAEMAGAGGPMLAASGVRALPMVTSTLGAGIGLEAGGDVAEGIGINRQVGEAAGALAGGLSPSLTGTAAGGAVGWLKNRFSPSAQRAAAEGSVAGEVVPLATAPAAQANLGRSLEVSDEFAAAGREFNPSLPARTGSPGLMALEKDLVTRNPGSLNKAVETLARNKEEISSFINTKFPAAKETSVARIARLQKMASVKLESIRSKIDDELDKVASVFERNPNNYEVGRKVRDLVFKQKEVYRGVSGQKYQAVYQAADRLGAKANIDDIAQFADDTLKSEFNAYQASEIPPVFRQLAKKTGKDLPEGAADFVAQQSGKVAGEVSFAELHSLYKRTNSDLASLRGSQSVDKGMKEHLLGNLKTQLEAKLAAFEEAGFGEVATKLKEANRFYREEYLPRFKQGFGDDILSRYGSGEFKVPNQEVVGMITKANNAQAAKDFKQLFGDVPEAWQSLRDGYMDVLVRDKNVLDATGKINQKVLDRFLRQHSQTLTEFPQVRKEFQQLALDNQALLDRQARVMASQKELAAAELYKLFNGKDPSVVVPEAVSNPNVMRVLVHKDRSAPRESLGGFLGREFKGDTAKAADWAGRRAQTMTAAGFESKAGQYKRAVGELSQGSALARAIAEDVVKQADPVAYFNKNKETIRIGMDALGKEHFKNIETAIEAITINSRSQVPGYVQSSGIAPDALGATFGTSPRAAISHYINVARGRTGVNQEAAAFIGRWFDKMRADHKAVAMEAVFYDKDAARAIANLAKQPKSQKFGMDFVNSMATLGLRAEIVGQE